MNSDEVRLVLDGQLCASLVTLLEVALALENQSQAVDYLPLNPWGDVDLFRERVFDPLHGKMIPPSKPASEFTLHINAEDVAPLRGVLDGIAESFTGGVPWVSLDNRERRAVVRLLEDLSRLKR